MRQLESFPRVRLAHLPTPLEPATRLGAALELPHLWFKRDDCTGLAMGGNKARKLEYLIADAKAQNADVLLTTGGKQSNHARMTAAAACREGMETELYLSDPEPPTHQGNLLLNKIFHAKVHFIPGLDRRGIQARLEQRAEELRAKGRRPYIIPVGGSTPIGSLGYVRAVRELAEQAADQDLRVDAIVVATGSTGTLSGMLLGARLFMPETRVYGISVAPRTADGQQRSSEIIGEAAHMLSVDWRPAPSDIPLWDDWLGPGYGIPTPEGMALLDLAARTEGYLLDPVYTGKALAGACGLAERGILKPDDNIVFWHTGGTPALFAFEALFSEHRAIE